MIIEKLEIKGQEHIFLVHIDIQQDNRKDVEKVVKWLSTVPNYSVLVVPNGKPCPTNPLPKITIFNTDNPLLKSVVEKISKHTSPGAIIPLTKEEMEAWVNSQVTDWVQI